MSPTRLQQYAQLIVERSLDVQPGWQVLIRTTPPARPLLEEIVRLVARRGAYPIVRLGFSLWPVDRVWAIEAPEELLGELPPIDRFAIDNMDARITISAPENVYADADIPADRRPAIARARRPFFRRSSQAGFPWVGCQYPTPALAQQAGMSTAEFEDFLYGAVLRDWDAEGERMRTWAERFTAGEAVRIVGDGTDLRIGLSGRQALVDEGKLNLPGGEFFMSPLEDATEGEITFGEFPTEWNGSPIEGIRLVFREGRVVEASAERGEDALLGALDTDEGARVVGELGIGCNEGITRHLKNTLFDEKMAGTIHLALGSSYSFVGGLNESAIHWDIVKDLRRNGRIELDGDVVQENGRWLI